MANNSILGTGTTIVFSFASPNQALSFVGKYRQIGEIEKSIDVLDDTTLASTDYREKRAGDLKDMPPIPCEIFTDPDVEIPIGLLATVTITYQPKAGQQNGATFSGTGFISRSSEGAKAPGEQVISNYDLQFDNKVSKVARTPGN